MREWARKHRKFGWKIYAREQRLPSVRIVELPRGKHIQINLCLQFRVCSFVIQNTHDLRERSVFLRVELCRRQNDVQLFHGRVHGCRFGVDRETVQIQPRRRGGDTGDPADHSVTRARLGKHSVTSFAGHGWVDPSDHPVVAGVLLRDAEAIEIAVHG